MSNIEIGRVKEAQDILEKIGLAENDHHKLRGYTLLALANIKPDTVWKDANPRSMTLNKDIIEFINEFYNTDYKPNTRELFKKIALHPFVENNIAVLNIDEHTNSKPCYSISPLALDLVRKYNSDEWQTALEDFKRLQFRKNIPASTILRGVEIKNFKSILDLTIDLGRFNVFIGTNGCGKSNILEAIATAGSSIEGNLNFEGLSSRGVRMARPDLIISSFLNTQKRKTIDIELSYESNDVTHKERMSLEPEDPNDIYTAWRDNEKRNEKKDIIELFNEVAEELYKEKSIELLVEKDRWSKELIERMKRKMDNQIVSVEIKSSIADYLINYSIYDLNTKSLRGVVPADSKKTPLGINGEGLDLLIKSFNGFEKSYLNKCKVYFDWLEDLRSDTSEKLEHEGLKPGRSTSNLFFTDKFMQKQNNTLSAESSNEGILYVLFYLALFISNKTPSFFAIDNIETALNPRLCQVLIKELASLADERGKQVLITTHNPAILDGLNLLDDEQRLFEVYRDSQGQTKVRRIKFKNDLSDKKFKLSEMWLKGLLGAVPENF
jgi:predicted ATPase